MKLFCSVGILGSLALVGLMGCSTAARDASNNDAPALANPVLTVSAGLKQLRFSWAAVPGASTYRVSYNADGVSGFVPVSTTSNNLTATTYNWDIPVHRINWPKAQFLLEACDARACVPSANVSAVSVMLGAIGYFKASNTGGSDWFGTSVALSADGNTLAVGALYEDGAKTGVTHGAPDETAAPNDALTTGSGAVYVFTRSAALWTQQAYVKASNTGDSDLFGASLALSADGNTLAVGAYQESSANTGVTPGAPSETDAPNSALGSGSGAAYVFTRSAAALWTQQAYVKASNTGLDDHFGYSLALSADGNTLVVGAYGEDGTKTGVTPGAPSETDAPNGASGSGSGAAYVFTRDAATRWSQQAYVKASNTESDDNFGFSIALSSDGNALAVGAYGEDSANIGVTSGMPDNIATGNGAYTSGAVYIFTRIDITWAQQAYVKASNTQTYDTFGYSVTLSADGNMPERDCEQFSHTVDSPLVPLAIA